MEKQAEIQISYVELEAGFLCYLYLQKGDLIPFLSILS